MADDNQTPPVLPPAPWYESDVTVRLVAAGFAQLVSIIFRTIDLLGYEIRISAADIDAILANVTQGVALVAGFLALLKRKSSPIQPLTLTKAAAVAKAETSVIDPRTMTPRDPPPA